MAYDSTEPQDDPIDISRPKLVTNFADIETYISRDHVSFDANTADSGKHTYIRLVEQDKATVPATGVGEGAFFVDETDHFMYFKAYNNSNYSKVPTAIASCQFSVTGGMTVTNDFSHNVASIVFVEYVGSQSKFKVTFTTAANTANYVVLYSHIGTALLPYTNTASQAVGSFNFIVPWTLATYQFVVMG